MVIDWQRVYEGKTGAGTLFFEAYDGEKGSGGLFFLCNMFPRSYFRLRVEDKSESGAIDFTTRPGARGIMPLRLQLVKGH